MIQMYKRINWNHATILANHPINQSVRRDELAFPFLPEPRAGKHAMIEMPVRQQN
jgi:hypothetical protein